MHSITFNGVNSRTHCKLFVSGGGTFNAPERDIESISVPGRNGDLTIDHGRYKNITVEYPAWIAEDFVENARKAREWLCSPIGYRRLYDDYNTDEYRMARFVDGLEIESIVSMGDHLAGTTTLKFDCMPQRFLISGSAGVTITSTELLTNPTAFEAKPIIILVGSGEGVLRVGDQILTITDIDGYMHIDCEDQIAIGESGYKNNAIVGDYPVLKAGGNRISFSGGITEVTIFPRWWRL